MSPWCTLATFPLSQAIVTAFQLVSVIMPLSAASPRQYTLVPFLRFLDSVTFIVAPPVACGRAHSTASSLSLSFLLALQIELLHFRGREGGASRRGRAGLAA